MRTSGSATRRRRHCPSSSRSLCWSRNSWRADGRNDAVARRPGPLHSTLVPDSMKINLATLRRGAAGLLGLAVLAVAIGWSSMRPSLARDWIPEHRLLPEVEERGDTVVIHNVRDFRWSTGAEATPAWRREAYDLGTVETVWYVLTPFSRDRRGPAHAFVSFGFRDGRFLAISVEARREQGEQYSVLRGMLRQYEVIYVIGEERDLVQQRVLRDDDVYVYPIRATAAQARALLEDMLRRANAL